MASIAPPPEFMPPSPFPMYEGNWTPRRQVQKTQNPYVPIVSRQVWPDKQKFLDVAKQIETYIYQFDSRSPSPYRRILHRGQIQSRLDPNVTFPVQEYWDMEQKIKWPAEYVGHYIGQFNVMPTKRFFDYIMYRMRNPFPGMPPLVFPAAQQTVPMPPPPPSVPMPPMPPPPPAAQTVVEVDSVDKLQMLMNVNVTKLQQYILQNYNRTSFLKAFHPDRCIAGAAAVTQLFRGIGINVNLTLGGPVACEYIFTKFSSLFDSPSIPTMTPLTGTGMGMSSRNQPMLLLTGPETNMQLAPAPAPGILARIFGGGSSDEATNNQKPYPPAPYLLPAPRTTADAGTSTNDFTTQEPFPAPRRTTADAGTSTDDFDPEFWDFPNPNPREFPYKSKYE